MHLRVSSQLVNIELVASVHGDGAKWAVWDG